MPPTSPSETRILYPTTQEERVAAITTMGQDPHVGAVVLPQFVESIPPELIDTNGANFSRQQGFQDLFGQLAEALPGVHSTIFSVQETGRFRHGKAWHLATSGGDPSLRFWFHMRGSVIFSVARAATLGTASGFGFPDEEVHAQAFALPIDIEPDPGDVIVFVDQGSPKLTGPSTFHKVTVPDDRGMTDRSSAACDLVLLPTS